MSLLAMWEVVYRRIGSSFHVKPLSSWACRGACGVVPGYTGVPRACRSKELRERRGGKRTVVISFSSFTFLPNCFKKVKCCLFTQPSYSSSGRDPSSLRCERRNPAESCETLAWFFPSPRLGCLHHPPPDTEILLLLILQKALQISISHCISIWQPASLCFCPHW